MNLVYLYETVQKMKIRVFDSNTWDIDDENEFPIVGEADFELTTLFQNGETGELNLALKVPSTGQMKGSVEVFGEFLIENRDLLLLSIAASELANPNWVSGFKPSLYFTLSKVLETGRWIQVYESPVVKSTINPFWEMLNIPVLDICNGDLECSLKFQIFDENRRLIGEVSTSAQGFLDAQGVVLPLFKEKTQAGKLTVNRAVLVPRPVPSEVFEKYFIFWFFF